MAGRPVRAVIYARVSTVEQNVAVQTRELAAFCAARSWLVAEVITDVGFSGGTGADRRPGLRRLMELAGSRKIDVVVVVKLDRLFRSLRHLVVTLDQFEALGVKLASVKDSVDLTTPAGRLLVSILGALGEFEKDLIRERTMAGLAHARAIGKRLGRPPVHNDRHDEIRRMRAAGMTYAAIRNATGVPNGVLCRVLKTLSNAPVHVPGIAEGGEPR